MNCDAQPKLNLGLISGCTTPAALFWRKPLCFISAVLFITFLIAFQARAEIDICSQEHAKDRVMLQKQSEWYSDKLREYEIVYYSAGNDAERKIARNKYIELRHDIANHPFRKFASDFCSNGTIHLASGFAATTFKSTRQTYKGFEALLIFRRLEALHTANFAKTEKARMAAIEKGIKEYPLLKAKQETLFVDWNLMLHTAIRDVEKIKSEALEKAASSAPAN